MDMGLMRRTEPETGNTLLKLIELIVKRESLLFKDDECSLFQTGGTRLWDHSRLSPNGRDRACNLP